MTKRSLGLVCFSKLNQSNGAGGRDNKAEQQSEFPKQFINLLLCRGEGDILDQDNGFAAIFGFACECV